MKIWTTAFRKEFGNMAHGDEKINAPGTYSIFIIEPNEIKNIRADGTTTYMRLVIHYPPQKKDPNRGRLRAGVNLVTYAGEFTTRTADITTSFFLWNSVLSTENAK